MTDGEAIDWHFLPGNPRLFFGLGAQFDEVELKRAYNRLIRLFKPDRHPDEFQKIRSAYESLKFQLENRNQLDDYSSNVDDISGFVSGTSLNSVHENSAHENRVHDENAFTEASPDLLFGTPEERYAALRLKPALNAQDYLHLAILSDLVADTSAHFADWLMRGVKAFPNSEMLLKVLLRYCQQASIDYPNLHRFLIQLCEVMPHGPFYFYALKAAHQLIAKEGFDRFFQTWQACETRIVEADPFARMYNLRSILRAAAWSGQHDLWIKEQRKFFEENFQSLNIDYDLEWALLDAFTRCRDVQLHLTQNDELLKKTLETLQVYSWHHPADAAMVLSDLQDHVVSEARRYLEESPIREIPHASAIVNATELTLIYEGFIKPTFEIDDKTADDLLHSMAGEQLQKLPWRVQLIRVMALLEFLTMLIGLCIWGVIFFLSISSSPELLSWCVSLGGSLVICLAILMLGFAVLVVGFNAFRSRLIYRIINRALSRVINPHYRQHGRSAYLRILNRHHFSMRSFSDRLLTKLKVNCYRGEFGRYLFGKILTLDYPTMLVALCKRPRP